MSLDELIDQELEGDAGGEKDPGGEGHHTQDGGGETFPGEVDSLEEDDDEGRDQDVRAPPQFELTEMVSSGEEGERDAEEVEGGGGHVGVRHQAEVRGDVRVAGLVLLITAGPEVED